MDPSHVGALKTAARAAHEVAPAIIPVAAAKKLSTETSLPKTNEFALAVKNTPGARIEDDRLVLPLTRNQRPEQSGAESVRGGVFYLPEGSPNQKYYTGSGFNIGYGGSEPIKGETALANPLFVKGATGGKVPEAAYVQLKGKDAFKDMQDDVYRSIGAYYLDKDTKRELVQQFLDKHAPDLSNHSNYILENSSKGNQLRYALQEAAVAQAARDAGHDAVVGYSMSRKTKEPFISEVFDVRENRYPTKSGEYGVWPKFEAAEPQMSVGPAERTENLAKFMENAKTPPVLYHSTHADISEFKPTKGSHLGFHFGDVEAANNRLEDTANKFPWPKSDRDERYAISEGHFNNWQAYENALRRKNTEVPSEELIRALDAGEDIGPIFKKYEYVPTLEEQIKLDDLREAYKSSQAPIIPPGGVGANIGAYHVAITNPLRLPDVGNWGSVKEIKKYLPFNTDARSLSQLKESIKEKGYDGIVYQNRVENPVMRTDSFIAFEPEQIKSAYGNRGDFNPKSPKLNEARGGTIPFGPEAAQRAVQIAKQQAGRR